MHSSRQIDERKWTNLSDCGVPPTHGASSFINLRSDGLNRNVDKNYYTVQVGTLRSPQPAKPPTLTGRCTSQAHIWKEQNTLVVSGAAQRNMSMHSCALGCLFVIKS